MMRDYEIKDIDRILNSDEILPEQRVLLRKWDEESEKNDGLAIASRRSQLIRMFSMAKAIRKDFKAMTRDDIQDYIYNLRLAPGSVGLSKIYTKKFFKWLNGGENYPETVIWIKTGTHKKRTLPEDILTPGEIKLLMDAADNLRDRALVSVIYESGCRLGEILGLRQKDVEPDQYGVIISIAGKTGPRRIRLIDSAPDLTLWLNNHPRKGRDIHVFDSPKFPDKSLTEIRVEEILRMLAKKAGIEKNVHPHLLRHSRATHLAGKMTDAELKKFFGWTEDSAMVGRYVSLSDSDIQKKVLVINGLITKEEAEEENQVLKARVCPRCKESNPATARFCYKCGMALDLETAMKIDTESTGIGMELLERMRNDPRLLAVIKSFTDAATQNTQNLQQKT